MPVNKETLSENLPIKASLFMVLMGLYFNTAIAQNPVTLEHIKRVELNSLDNGKRVQLQIDDLDNKRVELANEYRSAIKHNASLEHYNELLRQTIASQKNHIVALQGQIDSISNLDREIVPLMAEMLDTLEAFIALDIPFLSGERAERIGTLRALLSDGNTTNSEKYRRILEAYQIENDYGRTIEAYDGVIKTEAGTGELQTVTFLKVGRVAFLYQTLDRSQTYVWAEAEKEWRRLDDSYNIKVEEAIKMAREQVPPDLLFVPLETPQI